MLVGILSQLSGVPEAPLRLFLSLLATYPFGLLYRKLFLHAQAQRPEWLCHMYAFASGLSLCVFNYGIDGAMHCIAAVLGTWLVLRVLGPSLAGAAVACSLVFVYLLVGYWYNETDGYDINWTTSFCVLTLRLMGFAMDLYDGRSLASTTTKLRKEGDDGKLSPTENWDHCQLEELPSPLATLGYSFFFGGVLVGPQFPFAVYQRFVTLQVFRDPTNNQEIRVPSTGTKYALRCFLLGAFYLALRELGNVYFPTDYILEPDFTRSHSFLWRIWYVTVAGRVVLHKYIGCWLINEGGYVLSGISFRGYDPHTKEPLWNGLTNVNPFLLETATSFNDIIAAFNMNTNLWCKNYVFKRMRFLNNKLVSSLGTLLFLAIWHGFAFGYFFAFTSEFLDVEAERRIRHILFPYLYWMYDTTYSAQYASNTAIAGRILNSLLSFVLVAMFLSYGTVSFDLLTVPRVLHFASAVYYFAHVGVLLVFLLSALGPKSTRKAGAPTKGEASSLSASGADKKKAN